MENFSKIGSKVFIAVSILGIIGTLISVPDDTNKKLLILLCVIAVLIGFVWLLIASIGLKKSYRILSGAQELGLVNIKKNRLNGKNQIKDQIKTSKEIRLYAVSGQQVIEDYGEELRIALAENNAKIKVIFAMHGGSIFDEDVEKIKGNIKRTSTYSSIVNTCKRLEKHLQTADETAHRIGKITGEVEVGFFDTHNRIPTLICDKKYAAFHISLPPKDSNESVFFEVTYGNQSNLQNEDKFIFDLIRNFDLNWEYLKENQLVGDINSYEKVLSDFNDINNNANYRFEQDKIISGTRYYFDNKKDERNFYLGQKDKIFNHHFGIGDFDRTLLESVEQKKISDEIHRLELNQIDALVGFMGDLKTHHKILDAGCGRGGTSITINQLFKSDITGINISEYQVEFANKLVKELALKNIRFELMSYLDLKFQANNFDFVILNEVTQYALNLKILFSGFQKILKKNGKIIIATWCMKKNYSNENWAIKINEHYGLKMHTLENYIDSLKELNFRIETSENYSTEASPYFILRNKWDMKSGIEPCYIEGFESGKLLYQFIVAKK